MKNKFMGVERNIHQIKLLQMGAEVEVLDGSLHYVKYQLDENIKVKYAYHINDKGKYFLQRRSPYPLNIGTYSSQEDVINIIKHDLLKMKNAKNSKKFDAFIQINKELSKTLFDFEDFYLNYNICRTHTNTIAEKIYELEELIRNYKNNSEKIHLEK